MKEKAPQGGAIPESEGDSSNRADYEEKGNTIIRFPVLPGFCRSCIQCRLPRRCACSDCRYWANQCRELQRNIALMQRARHD